MASVSKLCNQAPRLEFVTENYVSYFSTNTYVVGTQKTRLNETVLFSTQNKCLTLSLPNFWGNILLSAKYILGNVTLEGQAV